MGWLLGVIAVLGLAAALYAHLQLTQVRKEASRRLTELEQTTVRTADIATRADAEARAARERAALLEARVAEEQGQREALEQLYADLSRGRDEAVLVEVERLVAMAGQELAISGNVGTALAALQTADARLARVDSARFVPLRRVIARDIEKLKAAPTVDVTGIALKLDQLATGAESWPLLSDPRTQLRPLSVRRWRAIRRGRRPACPGGNAGSSACAWNSASTVTSCACGRSRLRSPCCLPHSSSN